MDAKALKIEAARAALAHVRDGMRLGIGTGSTADGIRAAARRKGRCRHEDRRACRRRSAPQRSAPSSASGSPPSTRRPSSTSPSTAPTRSIRNLSLIKGGGGALLREKIVAAASARMIVIADESKLVAGARPLSAADRGQPFRPARRPNSPSPAPRPNSALSGPLTLRVTNGQPFVTDGGHFILDASFGRIPDTRALSNALHAMPGVVEHGLFLGLARLAIIAGADGIRTVQTN